VRDLDFGFNLVSGAFPDDDTVQSIIKRSE
jgi:hypothetical protein